MNTSKYTNNNEIKKVPTKDELNYKEQYEHSNGNSSFIIDNCTLDVIYKKANKNINENSDTIEFIIKNDTYCSSTYKFIIKKTSFIGESNILEQYFCIGDNSSAYDGDNWTIIKEHKNHVNKFINNIEKNYMSDNLNIYDNNECDFCDCNSVDFCYNSCLNYFEIITRSVTFRCQTNYCNIIKIPLDNENNKKQVINVLKKYCLIIDNM
jgi:hypothetical protein